MTFSTACFVAYLWSTYYVPETANVPLEEVDTLFRSSVGREDTLLKRQVGLASVYRLLPQDFTFCGRLNKI